jgi:DNA polymerase III epsilon subunit-like protein
MPEARLAFVDLETTGLSPSVDRVTEIGVITVGGGRPSEWTTLINPGVRVSEGSRRFNGIDSNVLADAHRASKVTSPTSFLTALKDACLSRITRVSITHF